MKQQNYFKLALAAIALIGLFWWLGARNNKPRYDWSEESALNKAYDETNDQPYGAKVFRLMLDGYFPAQAVTNLKSGLIKELPAGDQEKKGTYLFIGAGMYLDSTDTQHLLHFVENGNTALIISKTIPFDLMNYIYYEECADEGWDDYTSRSDSSTLLHLRQPDKLSAAPIWYAEQNQKHLYQWSSIPDHIFCEELDQYPLGYMKDSLINFAVFPHGRGRFLLHTTPIAFSNYHLLRPEMQQYAAGVLSHLNEGPIWWDAFSRVPENVTRRRNSRNSPRDLPEEHVLTYILKQEPLAWAWYILLGLAATWLLFRTRRNQRPIPVLPKNENSSYEFINTIAHLHFREKNYKGICVQAMRLFLSHIREKYGVTASIDAPTSRLKIDEHFYNRLSARSEIPEDQIREIVRQYDVVAMYQPNEQHLIDFHLALENFWKNAK